MQDFKELAPDEETFRRVWKRVMPDESASPIVVHRPGQGQRPGTAKAPPPNRKPKPEEPVEDEEQLRQMLAELDGALGRVQAIVRRQPGAWPIRDSLHKSAGQARSAWFLLTGRRWGNMVRESGGNPPLGRLLREQYIWELDFSKRCRDMGERFQGEDLRELMPRLEMASRRRREMIRNLLTRM